MTSKPSPKPSLTVEEKIRERIYVVFGKVPQLAPFDGRDKAITPEEAAETLAILEDLAKASRRRTLEEVIAKLREKIRLAEECEAFDDADILEVVADELESELKKEQP